jgi:hypothetical protein
MRILASSILVAGILALLWFGREDAWTTTLPIYRKIAPGETQPELVKVGNTWPLPSGTALWFRRGMTSSGTVLQIDGDRALVRLGTGDTTWLDRDQITGSLIAK